MNVSQVLGNIGEFVGAIAVVATLVYLAIQVRHSSTLLENNNAAMVESALLAKAAANDRYSDAVSRWRGRLIENEDVARLWNGALQGERCEGIDAVRFHNLFIDFLNTYRSNFSRARVVSDSGLERQAVMSVVSVMRQSPVLRELWVDGRAFMVTGSKEFVDAVEAEIGPDAAG